MTLFTRLALAIGLLTVLCTPARGHSPTPDSLGTAQDSTRLAPKLPFGGRDFTWMNGQNRQKDFPLTFGNWGVGLLYLDTYFNYNFANPIDHTQTISAVTGRHNEFQIALAAIGLEANYKGAYGRVTLQWGTMLDVIQDLDGTVARGRNLSVNNLKFIREATAGYHFDVWHGINVEMGIFMSYIGLESYNTQENWMYQRSLVCDFTPFYFSGARVTMYPSPTLKIEPWVMNGFQSYGKWNHAPATGLSIYYRPHEWLGLITNFYLGYDSPQNPRRGRFHHDHSVLVRYVNRPEHRGVSKAAVSLNNHYGFQSGGNGPGADSAYMAGTSLVNRVWFSRDRFALSLRLEYLTNPTRYLSFNPSVAGFGPNDPDGYSLDVYGGGLGFDFMPNDFVTLRAEYLYRSASVPYFTGRGGTTSESGYTNQPSSPGWAPDLQRQEQRIVFAVNLRL